LLRVSQGLQIGGTSHKVRHIVTVG
jgi:hypothetical protein